MAASTDQKARLLVLSTKISELVLDGKRNPDQVLEVFQIIKDDKDFYKNLFMLTGKNMPRNIDVEKTDPEANEYSVLADSAIHQHADSVARFLQVYGRHKQLFRDEFGKFKKTLEGLSLSYIDKVWETVTLRDTAGRKDYLIFRCVRTKDIWTEPEISLYSTWYYDDSNHGDAHKESVLEIVAELHKMNLFDITTLAESFEEGLDKVKEFFKKTIKNSVIEMFPNK